MLLTKQADFGGLKVVIHDLQVAGDVLPLHVHDCSSVHITVVARGRIKAFSHDWEKEASAGVVLNFREGEPHEIVALEDGTRIVNVLRNTFDSTTL